MAIVKTDKIINDANLATADDTYILIFRKANARALIVNPGKMDEVQWTKYQIKETDMRVKTASFTTNQYLDLTTGQYGVMITSPAHEDFGGVIISVEHDTKDDLYTYQCQDYSRNYQGKVDLVVSNKTIYRVLQYLITRAGLPIKGSIKNKTKPYKNVLSGLRPAWQYWERAWGGYLKNYNLMTLKQKMIIRNKSYIEAIRDIVFGLGRYIDVYFDKYGILHIEPYVKDEWLNTGLYITTPEIMNAKYKFDTTNIITGTIVHNLDKTKGGRYYTSEYVLGLDLTMFFGDLDASIENPEASSQTNYKMKTVKKGKTTGKKAPKATKKNTNLYQTKKKRIYLNTDSIDGYGADMGRMKTMAKLLKKEGWSVTITGVGSEAHWKRRGEVKNGIWFCLYGGACAGTLREHCTSDWFLNPLKKHKSRVVVGFFPPSGDIRKGGKYYKHLPPAYDWQNGGNPNIDYPAKFMSKHGIPFMYAKNAKAMVAKFLAGGDNFKTTGNSYKYHGSWQKHKPKWL